tara:strand:+ start:855 stop:1034 length:180 start_codon:yes stop_codon:yes gene_type:complete
MSDKVGMHLSIKATGSVEKSVSEDLSVEDPAEQKAKAILEGENEDTKGHDRERSAGDNK